MADQHTETVLLELQHLIEHAKSVPMSASCMVNRSDTIALVKRAMAALDEDTREAQRITATSLETLERAQQEADQIIRAAEDKADYLAGQTEIVVRARQKAADVQAEAMREADELRREVDAFIDQRIASFEAGLQRTMSQITTMRAHLAKRSNLDASDTQALPRLAV